MVEFTAQNLSDLIFWVAVTAVVFSGLGTLLAMLVWALARELFGGIGGAAPDVHPSPRNVPVDKGRHAQTAPD